MTDFSPAELVRVLLRVEKDLAVVGARWCLVGGLAVSARAEPRTTRDIDLAVVAATDSDAEQIVKKLCDNRGYRIQDVVEQTGRERMATVRLVPPGGREDGLVVDLLFASSGIEAEIVAEAEPWELLPGIFAPVATVGHLLALKVLADRDQDRTDARNLLLESRPEDLHRARQAVELIARRGYDRGEDVEVRLEELIRGHRRQPSR